MSRKIALIVANLTTALAVGFAVQGAKWAVFKSDECKFSVLLPGKPQVQRQPVDTEVGKVHMNLFVVPDGDTVYFVASSDYPADKVAKSRPESVLAGCRDGMVANQGGKLLADKAIKLGDVPGREFSWGTAEGFAGQARIYLKKNRLYQVMVLRAKGTPASTEFDRFFGSSKIL